LLRFGIRSKYDCSCALIFPFPFLQCFLFLRCCRLLARQASISWWCILARKYFDLRRGAEKRMEITQFLFLIGFGLGGRVGGWSVWWLRFLSFIGIIVVGVVSCVLLRIPIIIFPAILWWRILVHFHNIITQKV